MKKFFLLVILIMTVILGQSAPVLAADAVELKIATILPEDSELGEAIKYFKQLVEEKSNGEIAVTPYFGAVLGEEKSVLEQLGTADTEMNVGGSGTIIWHAPEYYITGIPFLYKSGQQVKELTERLIEERIRDLLIERINVRVLGGSLRAPRNLVTTKKKILHPEDVKGMKLRLPTYESWIKGWEAFGAYPTPIPGAEQFSAFQMGVIDATENPLSVLYSLRLTELGKYIHLTEHLHALRIWSISEPFYQTLSEAHKQVIEESADIAIDYLTERNLVVDDEVIVKIQEQGLEVVIPDKNAFREMVKPVVQELKAGWAPGLYEEYVKPLLEE
jgi:TRAP-type C4-dicarboxylate transport system substrate-binding protein